MIRTLSNKLYDTNAEIEKLRGEQEGEPRTSEVHAGNIFLY